MSTSAPIPPKQAAPWKPPKTALSEKLVSAAQTLFRQGLPDPRGCRYCAVRIESGAGPRGERDVVATHAWLIPSAAGQNQYAICWNGVIYPAVWAGESADLRADMLAALKAHEEAKRGARGSISSDWCFITENEHFPSSAASHQSPRPLWACLLLRLGEAELAEKAWSVCPLPDPQGGHRQQPFEDPYLELAQEWTWSLFKRALLSHMYGDDRIALETATLLVPIWKAAEAEAAKREYPPAEKMEWHYRQPSQFEDIASIPELLADQQRRAAVRRASTSPQGASQPDDPEARVAALKRALAECPDEHSRIGLLVQQLEELAGRESIADWKLELPSDPVIRAIIEIGESAVEPLLACLEHDTRLTRTVTFSCEHYHLRHGEPVRVAEAAYMALAAILDTDFFGAAITRGHLTAYGPAGRAALARRIHIYFKKYRGLPREERWYRLLLDDRAPMSRWVEAAEGIAQPPGAARELEERFPFNPLPRRLAKLPVGGKLAGESLRGKTKPTVSEILAQRANEVSPAMRRSLAMAWVRWDAAAALPLLRQVTGEALAEGGEFAWRSPSYKVSPFLDLLLTRMAIRDPQAWDEYGQWACQSRSEVGSSWQMLFQPLLLYPDEPLARAKAEWLFNGRESPWNPVFGPGYHDCYDSLTSGLLTLPSFRRQVARLLDDRRSVGRATVPNDQWLRVEFGDQLGSKGSFGVTAPGAPAGTTEVFRVCDFVAYRLGSKVQGMPRCELYWPEPKRDAGVSACARLLAQYGERFQATDENRNVWIELPILDHPATPEDFRASRAIFSLAGQGSRRVVRLPRYPVEGDWLTLKDFPATRLVYDPTSKQNKEVPGYDQSGQVWQAEEVLVGGVWRRYFGFISRHALAKVPAEEMSFALAGEDRPSVGGCEVFAVPPGTKVDDDFPLPHPLTDVAIPVGAMVHNRTGSDRPIPQFVADEGKDRPTKGIRLRVELSHAGRPPGESLHHQFGRVFNGGSQPEEWRPVRRNAKPFRLRSLGRPLTPAESFRILEFDLRDHFELEGPGWYRLVVKWDDGQRAREKWPMHTADFFLARDPTKRP